MRNRNVNIWFFFFVHQVRRQRFAASLGENVEDAARQLCQPQRQIVLRRRQEMVREPEQVWRLVGDQCDIWQRCARAAGPETGRPVLYAQALQTGLQLFSHGQARLSGIHFQLCLPLSRRYLLMWQACS